MEHVKETEIVFKDRTFRIKVVQDIDYLLGLVKTDDDVPFWAIVWPAALGLSGYIWDAMDFTGSTVLELGAGLGLAGIVAAAKGANLLQTDFIPEALELAEENAQINGIDNINYCLADWRDFRIEEKFDWIIGADILYEPKLHFYLKRILDASLKADGTAVLADPGRADAQRFIEDLAAGGYEQERVTRQVLDSGREVTVSLYFLTKKHPQSFNDSDNILNR